MDDLVQVPIFQSFSLGIFLADSEREKEEKEGPQLCGTRPMMYQWKPRCTALCCVGGLTGAEG